MKKYKAIIFDFDGTLVDSMPFWKHLGVEVLQQFGIEPTKEILKAMSAQSILQTANYLANDFLKGVAKQEIRDWIYNTIEKHFIKDIQLKEYALEIFEIAHEKGIKLSIATANIKSNVLSTMERYGVENYFDVIVSCDEMNTDKNSSYIFDDCTQKMGVAKQDVLVVEDAYHAIKTVKSTGYDVAGVYDKAFEKFTDEIKNISDYYFLSLKGLENLI